MVGVGEGGPPDQVPRAPDVNLSYDEVADGELLGQGGNADVYLAEIERDDGRVPVAVKQPRFQGTLQAGVVDQFQQEAEVWAGIDDHDHVVALLDWGEKPLPWLAMEYMDDGSLADVHAEGLLPLDQAAWVGLSVARAVRHAHRHGVAHLDIKPANVLFQSADGWPVPKVSDWGLAQLMLDETGSVEGLSPQYAAPEQFAPDEYGSPGQATDIYQLGVVTYELFVGTPPFEDSTPEVMRSVLNEEPPAPSAVADVPEAIDDAILPALARDPEDRYEDVLYLRDALETVYEQLRGEDTSAGSFAGAATTATGEMSGGAGGDEAAGTPASGPESPADDPGDGTESDGSNGGDSGTTPDDDASETGTRFISRRAAIGALGIGTIGVGTIGGVESGIFQENKQQTPSGGYPTRTATSDGDNSQSTDTDGGSVTIESITDTVWERSEVIINWTTNDNVLYGASGDFITKIDATSGNKQWENIPKSHVQPSVVVRDLTVGEYLYALGGADPQENITTKLYALDIETGDEAWAFDGEYTAWRWPGQVTASNNHVAFVETNRDYSETILRCLYSDKDHVLQRVYSEGETAENGEQIGTRVRDIFIQSRRLFVLGEMLEILDIETGEVLQSKYNFESEAQFSIVDSNNIYAGNRERVQKRNDSLEQEWTYRVPTRVTSAPELGPDAPGSGLAQKLVVPTEAGIICLNEETGQEIWQHQTTGSIDEYRGNIAITNGTVWALDDAGFLSVLNSETGGVIFEEQVLNRGTAPADLEGNESSVYLSLQSNIDSPFLENGSGTNESEVIRKISIDM